MLQGQAAYGSHRAQVNDGVIGLGRNLYAMLPEDHHDRGPQCHAGFRFVADVRLDNRPDVVAQLGLTPSDQARLPDAALLFRALLRWGDDAVDRMVGEFAFALWDGAKQQLLLGRDILGLRPLHFHRGKDFFAFASMPSGLHALDDVPYDFDREFMAETLALMANSSGRSYFKDIEKVPSAHIVRVTREGLQSYRYWRPSPPPRSAQRPPDYVEGLRDVLDQAVAAQLRGSGDTVASHLSSGLDSSAVTATTARLLPAGKVIAYTAVPRAGFDGPVPAGTIANEGELAAATARLYPNVEHILVENSGESPLHGLDRSFAFHQQPDATLANAVWGRAINRAARDRGVNILFKGVLGNLTVSYDGLDWLPLLLAQGRLPTLARSFLQLVRGGVPILTLGAMTAGPFLPKPVLTAVRRMGRRYGGLKSYSAIHPARLVELERRNQIRLSAEGWRRLNPFEVRLNAFSQADGGNSYKGVLAEWGLSVRDPTADRRVIEYSLAVPFGEFFRGGIPRSLARRAFADRLPPAVTTSNVRGLQAADWYEAFDRDRANVEQEIASIAKCAGAMDMLDAKWLSDAMNAWPQHGWDGVDATMRYRYGVLRAIATGYFMRRVAGTN